MQCLNESNISQKQNKSFTLQEEKRLLRVNWVSTEWTDSFDYLGKIDFIFETNLGCESGMQMGSFDEKKP